MIGFVLTATAVSAAAGDNRARRQAVRDITAAAILFGIALAIRGAPSTRYSAAASAVCSTRATGRPPSSLPFGAVLLTQS